MTIRTLRGSTRGRLFDYSAVQIQTNLNQSRSNVCRERKTAGRAEWFGRDRGQGCPGPCERLYALHLLLNPPCLLPMSIPSFSPQLDHHRRYILSFFPLHFKVLSLPSSPRGSQITSPRTFPRSVSVPCLNSESLPRRSCCPRTLTSLVILLCATLLLHHTSSARPYC